MPVKYDTPCPYCHSERRFEERICEGKKGREYKRYRLVCTECHAQSGWYKRKYECSNAFQSDAEHRLDVALKVRDEIRKDKEKRGMEFLERNPKIYRQVTDWRIEVVRPEEGKE